jgi:serine phosphatase RsbU (regulator of sigma subunit)/HAMP domain-containing protein
LKLTLRTKLIALTTVLVTGIMASVTYFFTIGELHAKREAVGTQIERIARNIATMQLLDRQDWSVYQDYINQITSLNDDIVYIAIFDDRQTLRAHTLNLDLVEVDQRRPLSRRAQAEIVRQLDAGAVAEESRGDLRTHTVNIQLGDRVLGSVHVGFSLIEINDQMRKGILRNLVMALIFLLISAILSFYLSRRLTRPLERLSSAMASIAEGDLEQRVMIETRDEIGQLARTFNDMVEDLRERRIIDSMGQELGATFQLERLARLVRDRLSGAIGAASARLYLRERDSAGTFEEILSEEHNGTALHAIHLDEEAQSHLLRRLDGLTLDNAPEPVRQALIGARVGHRELVIPMLVKGQLLGLLLFCLPEGTPGFGKKQRRFAATLASQAALALENAMLYNELREQERLKRELEIAREVQRRLLPDKMPQLEGLQLDGICLPAQEVGGDYYDFFHITDGSLGIVIADVSGKGTSASFYMAEIKGMMLTLVASHPSPKRLLVELNRRLYTNLDRKVFATMIYGVIDVHSRRFTFARAGHDPLLYATANGRCELITPAGIGLGLESGRLFEKTLEEVDLPILAGDTLLFFTDGVTEAMNTERELFGETRLLNAFCSNSGRDAASLRQCILESVERFVDGAHQHDDLTMVILRCSS